MQMQVHKGHGNYEPNTIDPQGPRETSVGLRTAPIQLEGTKVRLRAESFRDRRCPVRRRFFSMQSRCWRERRETKR
jgi:catalase